MLANHAQGCSGASPTGPTEGLRCSHSLGQVGSAPITLKRVSQRKLPRSMPWNSDSGLPVASQVGTQAESLLSASPCGSGPAATHHRAGNVDSASRGRTLDDVQIMEALATKDVGNVLRALEGQMDLDTGKGATIPSSAQEHLWPFVEDELCRAMNAGDCRQLIRCSRLIEVLEAWSLKPEADQAPGLQCARESMASMQSQSSPLPGSTAATRAYAVHCQRKFWEAEVHTALKGGNADDLHWSIKLAEEAGVPPEKLDTARLAIGTLASTGLDGALRHGKISDIARAIRVAKELGVDEVELAEAWLHVAKMSRDPVFLSQELERSLKTGVPNRKIAEAREFLKAIEQVQVNAGTQRQVALCPPRPLSRVTISTMANSSSQSLCFSASSSSSGQSRTSSF